MLIFTYINSVNLYNIFYHLNNVKIQKIMGRNLTQYTYLFLEN